MTNRKQILLKQMEETKANLSAKLDSLGVQVKTETAEAVTQVVRKAGRSLTSLLDVRHQLERHPWLVLGGSTVLGYLMIGRIMGRKKPAPADVPKAADHQMTSPTTVASEQHMPAHSPKQDHHTAPSATDDGPTAWTKSRHELSELAIHSLTNMISALASRTIPVVVDHIVESAIAAGHQNSAAILEKEAHPTNEKHRDHNSQYRDDVESSRRFRSDDENVSGVMELN